MKKHVITLSKVFLSGHAKAGQPTNFRDKFLRGEKIHTIRADEKRYWEKAIREVQEGKAILSVREWSGQPYKSKQETIKDLTAKDGVCCVPVFIRNPRVTFENNPGGINFVSIVSKNDGLSDVDFWEWFKTAKGRFLLIHFNKYRYLQDERLELF